jgi:uncharacterized protein (TIGR02271 family)
MNETVNDRAAESRMRGQVEPTATEHLARSEERLVANATTEEKGRLRLQKHVVEEPETIEVMLRHDELELERRAADRPLEPDELPVSVRGDETVVLVIEERLETRRVRWVVEEVHLRRRLVAEQQQVTETVRKERLEIGTEGDVDLDHQ